MSLHYLYTMLLHYTHCSPATESIHHDFERKAWRSFCVGHRVMRKHHLDVAFRARNARPYLYSRRICPYQIRSSDTNYGVVTSSFELVTTPFLVGHRGLEPRTNRL